MQLRKYSDSIQPILIALGFATLLAVAPLQAATEEIETHNCTSISRLIPAPTLEANQSDAEAQWVEATLIELADRGLDLSDADAIQSSLETQYPLAFVSGNDLSYHNEWNEEQMIWEVICVERSEITLAEVGVENPIVITVETTMTIDQ